MPDEVRDEVRRLTDAVAEQGRKIDRLFAAVERSNRAITGDGMESLGLHARVAILESSRQGVRAWASTVTAAVVAGIVSVVARVLGK